MVPEMSSGVLIVRLRLAADGRTPPPTTAAEPETARLAADGVAFVESTGVDRVSVSEAAPGVTVVLVWYL